jgi:hypothetical protein
MLATPHTAVIRACIWPRRGPANRSPKMIRDSARMPPAPTPCTPRPTTRIGMLVATPAMSDPAQKVMIAATKGPRRPRRSERPPKTGMTTVDASM